MTQIIGSSLGEVYFLYQLGHRASFFGTCSTFSYLFIFKEWTVKSLILPLTVSMGLATGVELTAFAAQLPAKLEELYLHTIALEKRVKQSEEQSAQVAGKLRGLPGAS